MPQADLTTDHLSGDAPGIARAADLLRSGALVAFPTETVYGLGADARDGKAVARIFAAKNRPAFNPLIVHVATLKQAESLADFPVAAQQLAAAFWPGPLTLVLPLRDNSGLSPLVSAGLNTVALRLPAGDIARALLTKARIPIAAPSANPSGRISPTLASHVLAGLNGRIAAVLDGGPCKVGLESTIIGFDPVPTLLRAGGLPTEVIEACLGHPLSPPPTSKTPSAPGQLQSHYAPKAPLRLNVTDPRASERVLGFGAVKSDLNLSAAGDLTEAAANLFDYLHKLDQADATAIAVTPIPDHGLGRAINDRLRRAAAPRP
ncbi:MAG TPA: threonylcarbamoyl-AMP synthase [Aliiroseovarius sp.]|nr:threonylcarbamoyl-AMP synthase [Aliiroseovarius sp.]